jgi:hypothetical protein
MRRYEHILLFPLFLFGLGCSAFWLHSEISHFHTTLLVEKTLVKKLPDPHSLNKVLNHYPFPDQEILSGKYLFYSSLLAIGAAQRTDLPKTIRLQWLQQANQHLPAALSREPANSNAWMHLAYTAWLLKGPDKNVINALRMSIYTSPENRQILLWRVKLACQNQLFWDADFRHLILHQLGLAWHVDPKSLVELAGEFKITELIQEALSKEPDHLARFKQLNPTL